LNSAAFSKERFLTLRTMDRDHFWFAGKHRLTRNFLRGEFEPSVGVALDLGCGPGLQLRTWRGYAQKVIGVDIHATDVPVENIGDGVSVLVADVTKLPMDNCSIDAIFAMDIVEHVPDDLMLAECMRVLRPDGVMIINVPAFQWLWSFRDVEAGHMRRYTKRGLRELVQRAGFTVSRVTFYQIG